jgi:hypothetical protein
MNANTGQYILMGNLDDEVNTFSHITAGLDFEVHLKLISVEWLRLRARARINLSQDCCARSQRGASAHMPFRGRHLAQSHEPLLRAIRGATKHES